MEALADDDIFGGSSEECRIFKETLHGNKTGILVASTSCERAPMLTVKEVMLTGHNNSRDSFMSKDSNCMNSSVSQGIIEQTHSENDLNPLVVQIESDSTVLHPCSDLLSLQDPSRVLEYSLFSGPSSSNISTAGVEPCINTSGVNNVETKMVSNLEGNSCKDSKTVKHVTSPISQESIGSKALVSNNNDGSNSRLSVRESPEDDELFEDVSLKDARQQLFAVVTRLMGAKGWHVEIVQRTCRAYLEKVYLSDTGKKVREFPKFWRLLGRSLSVNDNPEVVEHNKGWPDIGHYCKELSLTLARTDVTINPTATDSELASIWNILDPFVYFMFLQRKIKAMKKATFIPAFRSIPFDAFVKNNGELTFDKSDSVPKKRSGSKRKIQPSDSDLATNVRNGNENAKSGKVLGISEMIDEGSIPKKSKNARTKCMVNSRQGDKGKIKNVGRRGDSETSIFEKVTGMESSLFCSSLNDVHADSIKEWDSQDGLVEQASTVDGMPIRTVGSHYSNNKDALLAFFDHEMLQLSGISLAEKEFLVSPNVTSIEDTLVRNEMPNGSMNKIEIDYNNLHNVNIIWNEQEDLTCGKKIVSKVDVGAMVLESTYSVAVNEGRSFEPSKQIDELITDDDILLSAIKKRTKKRGRPPKSGSLSKFKVRKVKKKFKGRGRGRKLHTKSGGKGRHQAENEKCITSGARSPLSWLIDSGVVHKDDTIHYRKPQSNNVVKQGFLTENGIMCYCCDEAYSVSKFRLHAGAKSSNPCSNLFMDCGKLYELCQLDGWSAEYIKRKNHKKPTRVEDEDESDDICGLCGDGGDLVCCDNCPATFHHKCLSAQEVPDGDWYCFSCICHICGEFSRLGSTKRLKCAQCEHKYHPTCLTEKISIDAVTDDWFCSKLCRKVHSDIRSRVGVVMPIENGFSSTLLRCLHDDVGDMAYSESLIAVRAECNTKLAVALTIMEECFISMVDFRTGIDMIPHMVYNFGSNFPRLDFHGFYTVILEKDDVVMCVATIRIHGSSIAEIPLVATCSKYRRQGMCRLLMCAIEEMLQALKIKKIVMSAVPELVPTWVNGFGFQPVDDEEKPSLKALNLVVFPGTVSLQKYLLHDDPVEPITEPENSAPTISIPRPAVPEINALQLSEWHPMCSEPDK